MPDVSCEYILTTPAGTIDFNNDAADQFYIGEIPSGLAGAPISTGIDPVPFGTGSLAWSAWQRGRHISVEGIFLITSTRVMNGILAIRNQMEADLRDVLAGATGGGVGTLDFTPLGQSPVALVDVINDVALECVHDQGYLVRTFSFGLFCPAVTF